MTTYHSITVLCDHLCYPTVQGEYCLQMWPSLIGSLSVSSDHLYYPTTQGECYLQMWPSLIGSLPVSSDHLCYPTIQRRKLPHQMFSSYWITTCTKRPPLLSKHPNRKLPLELWGMVPIPFDANWNKHRKEFEKLQRINQTSHLSAPLLLKIYFQEPFLLIPIGAQKQYYGRYLSGRNIDMTFDLG